VERDPTPSVIRHERWDISSAIPWPAPPINTLSVGRSTRLALLTLTLALASAPAAALAAPTNHFNVKFTFTGQTFSDGTVGEIQAGSKLTGPNRG
jgi:hypothetical protein